MPYNKYNCFLYMPGSLHGIPLVLDMERQCTHMLNGSIEHSRGMRSTGILELNSMGLSKPPNPLGNHRIRIRRIPMKIVILGAHLQTHHAPCRLLPVKLVEYGSTWMAPTMAPNPASVSHSSSNVDCWSYSISISNGYSQNQRTENNRNTREST